MPFPLVESPGDPGSSHQSAIVSEERNLRSHAPFDSSGLVGHQFHLIQDRHSGFEDSLIILKEGAGDPGRKDIGVGSANEFLWSQADQVAEGTIHKDESAFPILYPEKNIRKGLEQSEGDLAGA